MSGFDLVFSLQYLSISSNLFVILALLNNSVKAKSCSFNWEYKYIFGSLSQDFSIYSNIILLL